jgi:hypothetical protein
MNDPVQVRRKVRMILSALPPNRQLASEHFLLAELERFFPEHATVLEMKGALEWTHARGYIDYRNNADEERIEWFLTESGRHKEGMS